MLVDQYGNALKIDRTAYQHIRRDFEQEYHILRARYDADQSNDAHWMNADYLGPNSASNPEVRRRLVSRSRYELGENNGYLSGTILTLAHDFVGRGPKLTITDLAYSPEQKALIESRWNEYAKKIRLRELLWGYRLDRVYGGEAFGIEYTSDRIPDSMPRVKYKRIETEQVGSNALTLRNDSVENVDGIRIDRNGEVTAYHVLYDHPGDNIFTAQFRSKQGRWMSSNRVTHWLRHPRPWYRGIPELAVSLPLCALLRRYTLAVVKAAETAASFSAVLETDQPIPVANPIPGVSIQGQQASTHITDYSAFPIQQDMMTKLPNMHRLNQLDPKQPTTMFDDFIGALVREAVRPLRVPFNVAIGFSGGYNVSSGNLDKQMYQGVIQEDRQHCELEVLDEHVLPNWWEEAILIDGYFESEITGIVSRNIPRHEWGWDKADEHVDPQKVATAQETDWNGGHISDTDIQRGRYNRDPEVHYQNLEKQMKARKKLGLPLPSSMEVPTTENEDEDLADG